VDLVEFDGKYAAAVAEWPTSAAESLHWCGRSEFPVVPDVIAAWSIPEDARTYLLFDDGEPVGYGELWLDSDENEVELARLIVAPDRRSQGVGRKLVQGLTGLAQQQPCAGVIFLRVHPDNSRAAKVYLAAGFQPLDEAEAAAWNAEQPVTYQWLTYSA
jgi:ribosomal protein S18 acetylase RimI-like enzyme